jgi:DNA primase
MAFPPGFLDELRARVSLAGLVGRRVKIERRGREFAGLCPFHQEKTPSFYVVEDKNFFHCFGCGAHGDAIGFLMRAENLDFLEAVERLAAEAGLAVPQSTPEERETARRQKTLLETLEAAAAFYERCLWSSRGNAAREYLMARGLGEETIRRFRLGWAPGGAGGQALHRALAADYGEPLLSEAGLLYRPDNRDPFDYFRDRVIFPIGDRAGRVIAFGGRVLGEGQPKYLNSPESPVFAKGRVLYGWSAARAGVAREADPANPGIILTEGYMDVIALHRAGFATAVAPLGTAVTEFQLREVWRLAIEPVVCLDADRAGWLAMHRILNTALPLLEPGRSLRFAVLPPGEDPDSLIRNAGVDAFAERIAKARSLSQFWWECERDAWPRDTPERRAYLESRLMEWTNRIGNRAVQAEYRKFFRERLYEEARKRRVEARSPMHLGFVRESSAGGTNSNSSFVRGGPRAPPRSPERKQLEILFCLLLSSPSLIGEVAEEFAALDIPEAELDKLRREILEIEALHPGLEASALRQHLCSNGFAATVEALVSPSVDADFLSRRSTAEGVRREWAHVVEMLSGGRRSVVAEASSHLITDLSDASWAHFLAARESAIRRNGGDSEPI